MSDRAWPQSLDNDVSRTAPISPHAGYRHMTEIGPEWLSGQPDIHWKNGFDTVVIRSEPVSQGSPLLLFIGDRLQCK